MDEGVRNTIRDHIRQGSPLTATEEAFLKKREGATLTETDRALIRKEEKRREDQVKANKAEIAQKEADKRNETNMMRARNQWLMELMDSAAPIGMPTPSDLLRDYAPKSFLQGAFGEAGADRFLANGASTTPLNPPDVPEGYEGLGLLDTIDKMVEDAQSHKVSPNAPINVGPDVGHVEIMKMIDDGQIEMQNPGDATHDTGSRVARERSVEEITQEEYDAARRGPTALMMGIGETPDSVRDARKDDHLMRRLGLLSPR